MISVKMIFRMLSLRKRKSNPGATRFKLIIPLLIFGWSLSACGVFSSGEPTVVSAPPTLEPATQTPESTSTQEPATPEIQEEPSPTPQAPQPTTESIPQVETLPNPDDFSWSVFATGLAQPLYLTHAGDQSGRIFVIEKAGRILIFQDGIQLEDPFLDIVQQVNSRDFERGLLGLAFHPNYAQNGLFFVNFTDLNGDTVVAKYQVSGDANRAEPDSQEILLTISQPYANHNGGMIEFGPDGYLYIGMGDGGSAGDPQGNAQNLESLLGKILRIDVDSGTPYGIPPGNKPGGRPEIWALGLRNPWRFSFDHVTGNLLIGDVGQNQWEEVHLLPAGAISANLGWDYFEGTHPYEGSPPNNISLVFPLLEYSHGGGNCSVTGGYTYRGTQLPDWQGVYLYGDYCSGAVWGAIPDANGDWQTERLYNLSASVASFGEDESGEIYLVDLNGTIYKLTAN